MAIQATHIKGFIAENLCRFHLQRAGFNIINSGKEWFDKELANKLTQQTPAVENTTLQVFNNIIARLPDFMIWKESKKKADIDYKFVEVKYREKLDSKVFVASKDSKGYFYLKYKCKDAENDSLQVYKYMYNLERLMLLQNGALSNLRDIEFYIYLVTRCDLQGNTNIYYGKVYGNSTAGYSIYFYAPKEVSQKFGNVWKNYIEVAEYLLENKKIETLYDKEMLYTHEDYEFLQRHIKNVVLS